MEENPVTIKIKVPKTLREEIDAIASKLGIRRETVLKEAIARGINLLKVEYAAWLYTEKKVSLGRAAEAAGVSLWELIDFLNSNRIPLRYRENHVLRDLGD